MGNSGSPGLHFGSSFAASVPIGTHEKGSSKTMHVKKLSNLIKGFISDEKGQSTTEYILILAVVVMIALKFRERFQKTMTDATSKLDADMQRAFSGSD